jgi:hypothetical protein
MRTDYKLSYLTRLINFYREYVDALVDQGQIELALEIADSAAAACSPNGRASPARRACDRDPCASWRRNQARCFSHAGSRPRVLVACGS